MRPVLVALSDGQTKPRKQVREQVADTLGLTEDDLAETLGSGQFVFHNRIQWATTYPAKAQAVERPQRGMANITDRGRHLLQTSPERITISDLNQFPEFVAFRTTRNPSADAVPSVVLTADEVDELTPMERIEDLIGEMESTVAETCWGRRITLVTNSSNGCRSRC